MSRMRHEMEHRKKEHEKRADGGKIEPEMHEEVYAGKGSNVEKEAEEKKHGGRMKKKHGGMVEGHEKKKRLDRPGRKTGGRIGADKAPLTTAAKIRDASEHDAKDTGNADEGP